MKIIYSLIILSLLFSCKNNSRDKKHEPIDLTEKLKEMNRYMVEKESKKIDDFILAHNFNVTRTGSGLRYEIYRKGRGMKPAPHDTVEVNYKVYLLNENLCYSNVNSPPMQMRLGTGEQITGLEEGLLNMVTGDKAHLVIPSHLAYGRSGDQNKIPPSSALYYDIELVKIVK